MKSQSVFISCGGVPAERTHHVCFDLAFLGALQPWVQCRTTTVLFPCYVWPWRAALGSLSDLPSSAPMLGCEVDSEPRGAFTSLACSEEIPVTPWKSFTPAERSAESHAGGFAFEFYVELMLRNLMYAFALFLSKGVIFISASFYTQYFSFLCKENPKAHWSPLQVSHWIWDQILACSLSSSALHMVRSEH